jgi:hypothetical protein
MKIKEQVFVDDKLDTFDKLVKAVEVKESLHSQLQQLKITTPTSEVHFVGGQTRSRNSGFRPRPMGTGSQVRPSGGNFQQRTSGSGYQPRPGGFSPQWQQQQRRGGGTGGLEGNRGGGCRRCGKSHSNIECRFANSKCFYCGMTGHVAVVCMSKTKGIPPPGQGVHQMTYQQEKGDEDEEQEEEYGTSTSKLYQIYMVTPPGSKTSAIKLQVKTGIALWN